MNSSSETLPLVSICIPAYNGEEFVGEMISSALRQTYPAIEIIVSDDESTDRTVEILKVFQQKSPFEFNILSHTRLGLVHNWNFCISQAKGKYIKFLFQDDVLEPECVEKMVAVAEKDDEIGLVFSSRGSFLVGGADADETCRDIYEASKNLHLAWSNLQEIQSGLELLADPRLLSAPINKIGEPSTVLLKKEIFETIGLFDTELHQLIDVDMWLRIMGYYKIGFVNETLSYFRIHTNQQTRKNIHSGDLLLDNQKLYRKLIGHPRYDFLPESVKQQALQNLQPHNQVLEMQAQMAAMQGQVEQLNAQLNQNLAQLEQLRQQFYFSQMELEQSRNEVVAMKTSKFWMMRAAWFKLKDRLKGVAKLSALGSSLKKNPSERVEPLAPAQAVTSKNPLEKEYKQAFTNLYKSALHSFLNSRFELRFPEHESPVVTVVLVLYNRAELTFQCLRSLLAESSINFEIVIVDNASTDETGELLNRLQGIQIIRNRENLNFLLACNQAVSQARGKYILFLNNDAQLQTGSLGSAIKTIESSPDIGAVGGKIILLDGSLQEAGSIVWRDGTCLGYGRGDSPFAPPYMYMRDVDYCSGAFLLTPRELFLEVGGFDEAYKPAYYEETDYCLKLWEMGKRIVYDPDAVILHFEFASSATVGSALELQIAHRDIFVQKHHTKLQSHYLPGDANTLLARTADQSSPRVLFIDERVPYSYIGAGYPRTKEILLSLLEIGCSVTFYPLLEAEDSWDNVYQEVPKSVEVMIGYGTEKIEQFLSQRAGYYDVMIISRPTNMRVLRPILDKHPEWASQTKLVYDAEALFSLRDIAQRQLQGENLTVSQMNELVSSEMQLAAGVQSVISVSELERSKFVSYGFDQVYTLGHAVSMVPTPNTFDQRQHILFVGAIHGDGSPNADSVVWFTEHVFPKIQAQLDDEAIQLLIVGYNSSPKVRSLASESVKVVGQVDDLADFYNQARIFIAPTRFAAGIPLKVVNAAAHGLPIVCTSLIASQLGWLDDSAVLVADDPSDFAQKCVRLYTEPELWNDLRCQGLAQVKEEYSREAFTAKLRSVI